MIKMVILPWATLTGNLFRNYGRIGRLILFEPKYWIIGKELISARIVMSDHLHIVTLNIPYPPDYGGMIDSYYRIKALHDLGVKIHLHCFEYGRTRSPELNRLCETVHYYPRKTSFWFQFSILPYIIFSSGYAQEQIFSRFDIDELIHYKIYLCVIPM